MLRMVLTPKYPEATQIEPGLALGEGDGVREDDGVSVAVLVTETVRVLLKVPVKVGVGESDPAKVGEAVAVGVPVSDRVLVKVPVKLGVAVSVWGPAGV